LATASEEAAGDGHTAAEATSFIHLKDLQLASPSYSYLAAIRD